MQLSTTTSLRRPGLDIVMQLIVIRHAATDGNRLAYVGREDLPLNDNGRDQAIALAGALSCVPLDIIMASPLVRARDTAAALAAGRGLTLDLRPELVEIDFGHLQGRPKHQTRLDLKRRHRDTPLPGGESLRDVERRIAPLALELQHLIRDGRSIAVVSHYWACRVLVGLMTSDEAGSGPLTRTYKPANASALEILFSHDGRALAVRSTRSLHGAHRD